jgi:CheY-like chemotaxis protein
MSMRRIRILVVDDSRVNRMMMTNILETEGYRLDEAGSGREAVQGMQLLPYDVVLMDIQMPEMDGIEATRQIRALDGAKGAVPIIGITGEIDEAVRTRALDAGMNAYLTKPVNHDALCRMIEGLVGTGAKVSAETPEGQPPVLGGLAAHYVGADRARLVDAFIDEATACHGDIEQALSDGAWPAAARAAHRLGGCAANIGLEALSARAAAIESACSGGDPGNLSSLVGDLAEAMRGALTALAPHRSFYA